MNSLLRTNKEIIEIYDRHVDMVYRVCYSFMKNKPETEDMVQETFLRLIVTGKNFESPRHEKAWLIVTASNLCKDSLKRWWRRAENIDDDPTVAALEAPEPSPILAAIMELPRDYKDIVYMFYYEGFSTDEIAQQLQCPPSTVRSRLTRARRMLKKMLGGEPDDE